MTESFCQLIVDAAESHADKVAVEVIGVENSSFTYAEMLEAIRAVAYRLRVEGIEFGDRVALIGENHPHWAIAYLGMLFAGVVCVPVDPHGEIDTIRNFFENSEAKMAFVGAESVETYAAVCEKLGKTLPAVILEAAELPEGHPIEYASFDDWMNTERPAGHDETPPAKPDDIAVLIYTSGTTGTPKGVPLSHGNIFYETRGCLEVMNIKDTEVVLSVLPLFHVFAQVVNLWCMASIGGKICYITELAPAEITKAFETKQITLLTGVPRLWYLFHKKIFDTVAAQSKIVQWLFRIMLATNGFLRDSFSINLGRTFFGKVHDSFGGKLNITISAGSRFDEKIARDYHSLGFTMIQGYGLSETSGAVTATRFEDNVVGSVGKAVNYAEIKLGELNDEGAGEVLIRGKMVFDGYYKNPEATKEAFTEDGWFRSGDLGKFDKNGHLFIVGRSKDVIALPNGKNIHPEDLEVKYLKSPLVEELAILGVKDEGGAAGAEKLIAVVVPDFAYLKANNISNSREAIRYALDDLGRSLPEYQRVRNYVIHTEPLPRTATRKIKRFELMKQLRSNGLADQEEQPKQKLEFTAEERAMMESPAGKAVAAIITKNLRDAVEIHPAMNLEIDLGLDSLGRAEVFAALEQAFNTEFDGDAAQALTVADTIKLIESHTDSDELSADVSTDLNWHKILNQPNENGMEELRGVFKNKPIFRPFAFVCYRIFNLFCRVFFRLEVGNIEELRKMERPFIIAPNHQSYIDPFVLCSNYPYDIFGHTFHVGAAMYFKSAFMTWLAKLLNVVPIDPDSQLIRSMRSGAVGLQKGFVLNIYPEGERAYDGELHDFKRGAAILAAELDVPILPVALDGLQNVWARRSWRIRAAKVKIHFGEAFYAKDVLTGNEQTDDERYETITEHLRDSVAAMIADMRSESKK